MKPHIIVKELTSSFGWIFVDEFSEISKEFPQEVSNEFRHNVDICGRIVRSLGITGNILFESYFGWYRDMESTRTHRRYILVWDEVSKKKQTSVDSCEIRSSYPPPYFVTQSVRALPTFYKVDKKRVRIEYTGFTHYIVRDTKFQLDTIRLQYLLIHNFEETNLVNDELVIKCSVDIIYLRPFEQRTTINKCGTTSSSSSFH